MDDATIVRTLAEFEGLAYQDEAHQIYRGRCLSDERELGGGYCGSAPFETHQKQMADPSSWVHRAVNGWKRAYNESLPDYLTSYDAVARVWSKTTLDMRITACGCEPDIENWWEATPRQHALALATAIAGHKENGNE